jgi:hypothetical protein
MLDGVTGAGYILAEAVSRIAARAGDGQQRGETEQEEDAFE